VRVIALVGTVVLSVALIASTATAAPSRDTLLRPGVGVGKVRLDMTFAQVRSALGKPVRIVRRHRVGFREEYVEYAWGISPHWAVGFYGRAEHLRVVLVETTRRERTRSGVGIGSTERALRRVLGASCKGPPKPQLPGWTENPGYPLLRWCSLRGGSRDRPVTQFSLVAECSIEVDRHLLCPKAKRTYRAFEVVIATAFGWQIRYPR
jgi:hypothetical protein